MEAKILVIDDEPLIATTIERALAKVGYAVTAVHNRAGFEEAMKIGPFGLIILDLTMEDLSEEYVRKEVAPRSPETQFLIISGSRYTETEYFLQKPFKIDELRKMVKEILKSD